MRILLLFSALLMVAGPALTQDTTTRPVTDPWQRNETKPDLGVTFEFTGSTYSCTRLGRDDADEPGHTGAFFGGLLGGALLGFFGTGIAILGQGDDQVEEVPEAVRGAGDECVLAYADAYGSHSGYRKRRLAAAGGLLGTALLVTAAVIVSASD